MSVFFPRGKCNKGGVVSRNRFPINTTRKQNLKRDLVRITERKIQNYDICYRNSITEEGGCSRSENYILKSVF